MEGRLRVTRGESNAASVPEFARLSAGGDWIRTSSTRARSISLSPLLCRRKLGTGRCALSVFGQHDALHQSGVDPTAEAAIRAGDAQRRI
jgi:hypothetical protein